MAFRRGLRTEDWDALEAMASADKPNWWQDLLALWAPSGPVAGERRLRLAVRNGSLNFYLKGQSVARVCFDRKHTPMVQVHVKYAFENATEQAYARLAGSEVLHRASGRVGPYTGSGTLREWMARAGTWETPEKSQVDNVISHNPGVIDLEMGLPACGDRTAALRIDLVALEASGSAVRVVFWEAKRASDDRLKSRSLRPAVMDQIDSYRDYFATVDNCRAVEKAYWKTCAAMVRFRNMACWKGAKLSLDPLVVAIATNEGLLEIDATPRLVVFGSRREFSEPAWAEQEAELTGLGVHLVKLRNDAYRLSSEG